MVIGVLGKIKAGGAYVPLDPGHPSRRLKYLVEDAAPVMVLTQGDLKDLPGLSPGGVRVSVFGQSVG